MTAIRSLPRQAVGIRKRLSALLALSLMTSIVVTVAGPSAALGQSSEPSCGADVALVVDSSGSVDSSELALMQDAFTEFVDAFLPATPTQMAVVEFDRKATVLQDFTGDPVALGAAIDAFESGKRTNWQDGLLKARNLFPHRDAPDLIVFASDGRPNKVNGSNEFNRPAALAAAVVEADAAKAAGARIIAIGIGDRLKVNKLEAIASSPDDVHTTDFDTLAQTLADLADELCGGTITVNKVLDLDGNLGTTDDQEPGVGWTFTPDVTGAEADPPAAVTGASGSVVFTITDDGATVDLYESGMPGYVLLDASCEGATDNGASNLLDGITGIVVGDQDAVTCTFINIPESVSQ